MNKNIEVKASLVSLPSFHRALDAWGVDKKGFFKQEDLFFRTSSPGRLKLRIIDGDQGELIYYMRDDHQGASSCEYQVEKVESARGMESLLLHSLGLRGKVIKRRELFLWQGKMRIHLDEVDGLGTFMELERMVQPGESQEVALKDVHGFLKEADISEDQMVGCAYIDLLERKEKIRD